MKKLVVIRHAKSNWESELIQDFDRSLNPRGHRDAPMMGKRLKEALGQIDIFISSTAVRAFTTATYIAAEFNTPKEAIQPFTSLYHAPAADFYPIIAGIDNQYQSAAIVAHNPGITYFVNELTNMVVDNMPTCGAFCVEVETNDWAEFSTAPKRFLFFDYPKAG